MTDPATRRTAIALGVAGLLPQAMLAALVLAGRVAAAGPALAYAGLILSFIGGIWWAVALTRGGGPGLLLTGIAASLAGFGAYWLAAVAAPRVALALLGLVILVSWAVDRGPVRAGRLPRWWLPLRILLSTGLGGLTLLIAWAVG